MLELLIWLMLILATFWAFTRFYLQGEDLTRYDRSIESSMRSGDPSQGTLIMLSASIGTTLERFPSTHR